MSALIDHDALFKLLLSAFFREFLELFTPDLAADLTAEPPTFLDKESFSDLVDPDRREADLVVQMRLRDRSATLLIHLEHQAQPDAQLGRRMFRYFTRFYDRYDLPIYPIALCSYPRPRRIAPDLHQLTLAQRAILDFRYQVIQLNRLDWRAYLDTENPLATALMARMRISPADRWRVKAACLRLLARIDLSWPQRRLIGQFVDIYLPLNGIAERQSFQAEVASFTQQEQEVAVEFMTSWEREGLAKGLAKGRAEGRAEGQRELIHLLLARKISALPSDLGAYLAGLAPAQLTKLAEALLDFSGPDDLRAWQADHPPATQPEREASDG